MLQCTACKYFPLMFDTCTLVINSLFKQNKIVKKSLTECSLEGSSYEVTTQFSEGSSSSSSVEYPLVMHIYYKKVITNLVGIRCLNSLRYSQKPTQ